MIDIEKVVEEGSWKLERGFFQVEKKKRRILREELKNVLGITSRNGWRKRYIGKVEPTISEFVRIITVFGSYNVTDVFGQK